MARLWQAIPFQTGFLATKTWCYEKFFKAKITNVQTKGSLPFDVHASIFSMLMIFEVLLNTSINAMHGGNHMHKKQVATRLYSCLGHSLLTFAQQWPAMQRTKKK